MYKNYIFDLYGTLADIRTDEEEPYLWQKMSEFYSSMGAGYTDSELKEEFRRLEKESIRCKEKKMGASGRQDILVETDLTGVFRSLFEEKGVVCKENMDIMAAVFFRTLSRKLLVRYDGVEETFKELKKRGRGIYLLSNAQTDFTRPELELLGLSDSFDGILISSEEGCRKPCSAFFNTLFKRYNLNVSECLMVGNDENSDICGAVGVGMDSLYLHTATSPSPQGKYRPTYSVMDGDWGKVAEILLGGAD